MYGRALFFVMLIVVGAVLPYLLTDDAWLAKVESMVGLPANDTARSSDPGLSPDPHDPSPPRYVFDSTGPAAVRATRGVSGHAAALDAKISDDGAMPPRPSGGRRLETRQLVGPPGITLDQVLNFEVTPDWIVTHWSRVTTRLAELDLHGWRVPLSLHEAAPGLAGSVTYYFDRHRQVQRILLHGYTGDTSEIVRLAVARYQMRRVPSTLSDLYVGELDGRAIGALRVDFAPIMDENNSRKRYEVLMELNRRGTKYGMSREFGRTLARVQRENHVLRPIPTGDLSDRGAAASPTSP